MSRNIVFGEGEYYHIYNRGVDKREIFLNTSDYERFLALLYLANSSLIVDLKSQGRTLEDVLSNQRDAPLSAICAYCLMPNHFHLLVKEIEPGGLSKFMQKLSGGYTMYFNARYKRSGALFQGSFKAKHAKDDEYLKHLMGYIHLNPISLVEPGWEAEGIKNLEITKRYLSEYRYSSYIDYAGVTRQEGHILSNETLPEYFSGSDEFKNYIDSLIQGLTLE